MADYAISNVPRRVVYAASGVGPYAFTFEILVNTDVAVYRDDALLTLTTDYTVTIAANGTGSITLVATPTGATQIAIVGSRAIQRTSDFVTGGDFFANTVNDELDSLTIFAQQNAEGLARALQAPQTDPLGIDMTLPRASVRANKTLAFDSNGNPVTGEVIGDNRGDWAAGTAYNKRDIVRDAVNGNVYYANQAHTSSGVAPIDDNADAGKWDLLVDNESASASAAAAAASETAAAGSASAASTSATNAASSASAASTSATNAASSASSALSSKNAAEAAASTAAADAVAAADALLDAAVATATAAAAGSASAASTSAANALASLNDFKGQYYGPAASDPAVDPLGNAPTAGDLYFNTSTNRLRVYNATTGTWNEGNAGSVAVQNFNGTGSQTAFTLAAAPESENNTQVYISGVYQQKDQYSISGATLTFTSAPPAGTNNIEVVTLNTLPLGVTSADLVQYQPAGAGAVPTTLQNKLRDIMVSGPVPLRPAYLDQFIDGFFGRGMLTDETDNTVTEQFLAASASAGAGNISVTSATNFLIGGCVTVLHSNGRYGTYFVFSKTGNVLAISPSLRYAVSTASKIERTWFNRAHPGKFYMRELAQRIAHTTELEAAMPSGGRVLFTNFSSDPNTFEDSLVSVSGGTINYFAASNVGSSGDITTPVRFAIGRTAYVDTASVGSGAETRLFAVNRDTECVAKLIFAATSGTPTYKIEVLDETGKALNEILATYNAPNGFNSVVLRTYTIPFNTRSAKYLKVRVTCASDPSGAFILDQVDVFEAPATNGLIVSKRGAKIVCIGDSWVAGDLGGSLQREPITQQLALELPDATIINAGIGGNKIWEQVARFDTDVAVHNPDYVVVNTGTNEAYNPASAVFDPNSIDFFIYQYRLMINKIIGIGAKPIILGVPALAQSDAGSGYTDWLVNDRARGYVKAFYEWQGIRPLALGAHSGLESYRTDALLTSGATPSVAYMRRIDLEYGSATTITNLLNGVSGQIVTLAARNGNVTLQHGTLLLDGAANVTLTTSSTITLMRLDPLFSSGWVEIGRSIVQSKAPVEIELTTGTTPLVAGATYVNLNYASATTITNFTGGVTNQEIQLRAMNGNVTLTHSIFQLTGSTNVTLTTNSIITLRKANTSLTAAWYEVSRSIK